VGKDKAVKVRWSALGIAHGITERDFVLCVVSKSTAGFRDGDVWGLFFP